MSTPEERAKARANWPIRAFRLGEEPTIDDRDTSTAEERIRLVATLTREQWALSKRALPSYSRSEIPGRVVRGLGRE